MAEDMFECGALEVVFVNIGVEFGEVMKLELESVNADVDPFSPSPSSWQDAMAL